MVALALAVVAMAQALEYDREGSVPFGLLKCVIVCLCSWSDLLKKNLASSQIVVVVPVAAGTEFLGLLLNLFVFVLCCHCPLHL